MPIKVGLSRRMVAGRHYFVVDCARCSAKVAIIEAPGSDTHFPLGGQAEVRVTCRACGHTGDYKASDVAPFQAQYMH